MRVRVPTTAVLPRTAHLNNLKKPASEILSPAFERAMSTPIPARTAPTKCVKYRNRLGSRIIQR